MKIVMTVLLLIEEQLYIHYHLQKLTCSISWQNSKVIKEVQDDLYTDTNKPPQQEKRIIITLIRTNADADDDFGFTTQISEFYR